MSTPTVTPAPTPTLRRVIVKQVLSGDSIITRGQPRGGPPPENQVILSYVNAPKLARRPGPGGEETKDEPWAWEAREFLRKKLIDTPLDIYVAAERAANSTRDYGTIYIGDDINNLENVTESIVSEGLVSVRRENIKYTPELQRLIELEDAAKAAQKGKWGSSPLSEHVRSVKWAPERTLFDLNKGRQIPAIIEHVRDGSTVRAFLLPDFNYITLMISGIRCPGFKFDSDSKSETTSSVPFADEAKFFVESRLLQRDVEIILESLNNNNFVGSIVFHKGNIAEALLREGLAKCVDWSMAHMKSGADKLRLTEKQAKEKRVRMWHDYQSNVQTFSPTEKDLTGTVTEILNGDCLNVKIAGTGNIKKIFLSSVRPPRKTGRIEEEGKAAPTAPPARVSRNTRPLYDIPWMFECREYLRKKLIGKKVKCVLDYVSSARDNFPEKYCYTVFIGDKNVAEALIGKGLATVIRYRQDDDQRSSHYDDLLAAEQQANKGAKGIHAKRDIPAHHVNDLTVDHSRIKQQYLPAWQRALRTEAIVEFVASGSRFRIFIPKDSCIVTFLLAGISCPRSSRPAMNDSPAQDGEPYGDEALAYVKDKILQRDVSVHMETCDKAGTACIGWLWTEQNEQNLSIALVEEGLATLHFSAEKSEYYKKLKLAEDTAKAQKKKIWSTYVEEEVEEKITEEPEDIIKERIVKPDEVILTEVTQELHFYAQYTRDGAKLENLMSKLRQEFEKSPPTAGSYNPKRGDLCAARFSEDNEWYRAKVERLQANKQVSVIYIDYGNKELTSVTQLAPLPIAFISDPPYAKEFGLALAQLPRDDDNKLEAYREFCKDALNRNLLLNVEYRVTNIPYATLTDTDNNDICKGLIRDGMLLVDKRKEKRIAKLVEEYKETEAQAIKAHQGVWEYGDITEDDAKEFGR